VEGLRHDTEGYKWVAAKAGDYIHVPGGAQHAWRNLSGEPLINLIITTKKLGRFFREAGRPVIDAPQPVAVRAPYALRDYKCQIRVLERHARRERSGRDRFEFLGTETLSNAPNRALHSDAGWAR
jgi:hypothetical protein